MRLPALLFLINSVFSLSNPYSNEETVGLSIERGFGRRFDGIGAISGGGVSDIFSKCLICKWIALKASRVRKRPLNCTLVSTYYVCNNNTDFTNYFVLKCVVNR